MRTPTLLLLSLAISTPALAQSTGLADVAKKAEAQRKDVKDAGKSYSNDDLKPVAPVSAPAVVSSGASADAAPGSAPAADQPAAADDTAVGKPAADTKDRAYWAKRMAAARDQRDTDRVLLEALQSRVNALSFDFANRDDPAQRSKLAQDRQKALGELERMKQVVAADEKAIPALEDEARRAGAPAGWLR